jgi:hypothetical protein
MDNHFGPTFAGVCCGRVRRSIVNDKDVIELLKRAPGDIGDMFLLEVRRYDRSDGCAVDRAFRRKLS